MFIACDEAGHTGPDLLSKDQRFFAFASANVSDEEAYQIIEEARKEFPVQMPELKASKLMKSKNGRALIEHVLIQVQGRIACSAHDKLLALCGWLFEYIFEPVYQNHPEIFYKKDFHRFIAMFCYLWVQDKDSDAPETVKQFQAYMRSKDTADAPILFERVLTSDEQEDAHPFELVRRFATAHRNIIEKDNASIKTLTSDQGLWTLDLSTSGLWSHLNHWGTHDRALTIICDDSKPLKANLHMFDGSKDAPAIQRAQEMFSPAPLGWKQKEPIQLVDSRNHPSVQIADIVASASVYCFSNGMPQGFDASAKILDASMLQDSIFPDYDRVTFETPSTIVNYAVLMQLVEQAEGRGIPMLSIEAYFEIAESAVKSGDLKPKYPS